MPTCFIVLVLVASLLAVGVSSTPSSTTSGEPPYVIINCKIVDKVLQFTYFDTINHCKKSGTTSQGDVASSYIAYSSVYLNPDTCNSDYNIRADLINTTAVRLYDCNNGGNNEEDYILEQCHNVSGVFRRIKLHSKKQTMVKATLYADENCKIPVEAINSLNRWHYYAPSGACIDSPFTKQLSQFYCDDSNARYVHLYLYDEIAAESGRCRFDDTLEPKPEMLEINTCSDPYEKQSVNRKDQVYVQGFGLLLTIIILVVLLCCICCICILCYKKCCRKKKDDDKKKKKTHVSPSSSTTTTATTLKSKTNKVSNAKSTTKVGKTDKVNVAKGRVARKDQVKTNSKQFKNKPNKKKQGRKSDNRPKRKQTLTNDIQNTKEEMGALFDPENYNSKFKLVYENRSGKEYVLCETKGKPDSHERLLITHATFLILGMLSLIALYLTKGIRMTMIKVYFGNGTSCLNDANGTLPYATIQNGTLEGSLASASSGRLLTTSNSTGNLSFGTFTRKNCRILLKMSDEIRYKVWTYINQGAQTELGQDCSGDYTIIGAFFVPPSMPISASMGQNDADFCLDIDDDNYIYFLLLIMFVAQLLSIRNNFSPVETGDKPVKWWYKRKPINLSDIFIEPFKKAFKRKGRGRTPDPGQKELFAWELRNYWDDDLNRPGGTKFVHCHGKVHRGTFCVNGGIRHDLWVLNQDDPMSEKIMPLIIADAQVKDALKEYYESIFVYRLFHSRKITDAYVNLLPYVNAYILDTWTASLFQMLREQGDHILPADNGKAGVWLPTPGITEVTTSRTIAYIFGVYIPLFFVSIK